MDKEYFKDNNEPEFLYQMLSRLESDCKYFLGNGNGYEKHLWASNVDNQISAKEMKAKLNEKNLNSTEKNHKRDNYER